MPKWSGILVAGIALACGTGDGEGTDSGSALRASESRVAEPEASDAGPVASPATADAQMGHAAADPRTTDVPLTPTRPLRDLLRLPASIRRLNRGEERLEAAQAGAEAVQEKRQTSRLHIDLETQRDDAEVHPTKSRTRTDAGVSLDVGDTTKIRGGVRVEQETDRERDSPVPMIGIEKRF